MMAGRVLLITAAVLTVPLGAALAQADTVPPAGVVEREIKFPSGAWKLSGTLTEPEGAVRTPIAVIIAGSGPTDRNGNARMGLRTNTHAQLAWGLAKQVISSFRYDKRVLPSRTGTVDFAQITFDDFVTDVAAAATVVRGSAYSTIK